MQEKCKAVLDKVKSVLDDDDSYNELISDIESDERIQKTLDEYLLNRDVYERSKSLLDDMSFSKQIQGIDDDVLSGKNQKHNHQQEPLGKLLLENLNDLKSQTFDNIKEEILEERRKENIFKLLIKAGIDQYLDIKNKDELLKAYEDMLRISFRGFYIVHKRDVDEVSINNYNEEWIRCWDSNMDIQITMDYFAVITYITDYYMKDDTGTMEYIQKAIKSTENDDLRKRLKIVKNTFLTHRQMGETESY